MKEKKVKMILDLFLKLYMKEKKVIKSKINFWIFGRNERQRKLKGNNVTYIKVGGYIEK
jgi:hypothetical protein